MIGTIIGIIGVILTVVFGYYSIRLSKRTKQLTKLQFKRNECFSLFDSAIEKLNIDIKYHDKKVENQLILFKGEIINNGTMDIDKHSIYEPLKIITSDKYEWLEINSINKDLKINSNFTKLSKSEIEVSWDLLKKDEKIEFEALVEAQKKDEKGENLTEFIDFYNSLEFSSRITNLDKIECIDRYIIDGTKNHKFKRIFITNILVLPLVFLFLFFPFSNKYFQTTSDFADIYYEVFEKKSDSTFISKITPLEKNLILVEDNNGNKQKISNEVFNSKYGIKRIVNVSESNFSKISKIGGILLSLIILIQIIYSIFFYKRKIKPNKKPKC